MLPSGTRIICMIYVARVSGVGYVPCSSCTTSHNGRRGLWDAHNLYDLRSACFRVWIRTMQILHNLSTTAGEELDDLDHDLCNLFEACIYRLPQEPRLFFRWVHPVIVVLFRACLLYTSPSPRDKRQSRMPSSA